MEEIRLRTKLTIELLTESTDDGWSIPVALLVDEEGEIDPQLFTPDEEGGSRLRRATHFFEFNDGQTHYCVAATESTPTYLKLYQTTDQDPDEFWETLRCASVKFVNTPAGDAE